MDQSDEHRAPEAEYIAAAEGDETAVVIGDRNREVYRPLTFLLFAALGVMLLYSFSYPLQRTYQSLSLIHI